VEDLVVNSTHGWVRARGLDMDVQRARTTKSETLGFGLRGSPIQVEHAPTRPASALAHRVLGSKWLNARRLGCPSPRATISLRCGRSNPSELEFYDLHLILLN
jgi:hypothetical protein